MICIKCGTDIPDESIYCSSCGKKQIVEKRKSGKKLRGNGQGSVYRNPKSGNWVCQVVKIAGGKRKMIRKYGFKTKKEALAFIPEISFDKAPKKTITILETYQAIQPKLEKLSEKRLKCYESAYKQLKPIEMQNINDLSLLDLQSIIDDIDGGYYSKRYVKDLFSKLFSYAFVDGKVERNIVPYIELPPNTPVKEKTVFTRDEINKLWREWNAKSEIAGYILILIYCGLRTGELWSVRTNSVDFEQCIMFGGIKNAKGKLAPIFIVQQIEPVIRYFVSKNPNSTLYVGYPTEFYRMWRELKQKMGFRDEVQPYSGRHTTATVLAIAGVPESVIMNITRHEKYDTTLKYTHIDIKETLSKMQDAMNEL